MNIQKVIQPFKQDQAVSILVVDDEISILEVIRDMLGNENYEVLLADSLGKASQIIKDKEISIIITDLVLDEGSGVDVIHQAQKYQPDAKIILVTGKPTIQNAISVIKEGAFDYLVKPFDMEHLLTTVRRAVNQFKLERENIRLNEIMSFYRISEAMGSVIESDRLLNLILETAIREFKADFAAVHLVNPENMVSLKKHITHNPQYEDILVQFSQELAEDVYSRRTPVVINEKEAYDKTHLPIVKSAICQLLMAKGERTGTICLVRTSDIHQLTTGQLTTLSLFAGKAAMAIENAQLYTELEEAYFDTVAALANAIEARDKYTAGHTERVWEITEGIANTLGWDTQKIKELKMGALLHDIGKIGVPDAILNKPGPLDPKEQEIMKTHPELGAYVIRKIKFLEPALPYILYHHERYDGLGYPEGLKGENIPIQGRLLAVVDTYDAITSDRPYRVSRSKEEAISEIRNNVRTQFDPLIVEAFLETIFADQANTEISTGQLK